MCKAAGPRVVKPQTLQPSRISFLWALGALAANNWISDPLTIRENDTVPKCSAVLGGSRGPKPCNSSVTAVSLGYGKTTLTILTAGFGTPPNRVTGVSLGTLGFGIPFPEMALYEIPT